MTVASACSLRNGVQPSKKPDHASKVDINPCLNELRAHAEDRQTRFEPPNDGPD
jgi:hypothetical protein